MVQLPQCAYHGSENAQCVDHKCTCVPTDFTDEIASGWNCGQASSGCGLPVVFGGNNGNCPDGQICTNHICCTPATYPETYECGVEYDVCTQRDTTFTSAMEVW